MSDVGETSPGRSTDPSRYGSTGWPLVGLWVASVAGLVHAAFSAYWALGGRWLLDTVGEEAVRLAEEHPLQAALVLGGVTLAKLAGVAIPLGLGRGVMPWPRVWRLLSWIGGIGLLFYGLVIASVAAAVLMGWIVPGGEIDRRGLFGHAALWNPLFALWGGALLVWLWGTRPSAQAATQIGD